MAPFTRKLSITERRDVAAALAVAVMPAAAWRGRLTKKRALLTLPACPVLAGSLSTGTSACDNSRNEAALSGTALPILATCVVDDLLAASSFCVAGEGVENRALRGLRCSRGLFQLVAGRFRLFRDGVELVLQVEQRVEILA